MEQGPSIIVQGITAPDIRTVDLGELDQADIGGHIAEMVQLDGVRSTVIDRYY